MTSAAYAIDARPCTEAAFYVAACDPRRSVAVQACAGAGKTWMLVSRILRALLDGAEPQQILAITFTRKAAGEMRQRLDEWLAEFAAPVASHATRVQALLERGVDAARAEPMAHALGGLHERLLRSGRAVEVHTFHGWFAQLVTQAPLELLARLALPQPMELIEDTEGLRGELFKRFHAVVDADAVLRQDYFGLVRQYRRATLMRWLDAAWDKAAEISAADAADTLADAVPSAAALYADCAGLEDPRQLLQQLPLAHDLAALALRLGASARAKALEAAGRLRAALEGTDREAAFDAAWNALFTRGAAPRQLGDVAGLEEARAALQRLAERLAQHQGHLDHARMMRLSRALSFEFAALKRRRGLVDMPDLERAALALLSDPVLSGWLQERLDLRLRHVLIDEFQDTSPLQWQALHGWLAAYAGAGGGASGQRPPSVFIVGDPKQSIYRFRRAEPRVFDAAKVFVTEGLGGVVLDCDHTRRCAPAVVEALNAVFGQAALAEGWTPYRAHTTAADGPGAMLKLPEVLRPRGAAKAPPPTHWRDSLTQPRVEAEEQLRLREARGVAVAVAALMHAHRLHPGEVMVLARQRSVLRLVAQALAEQGLAHVTPEALVLSESPEALDLIALLDVLASPGHDISLARALKSPLLGADDADLLWLAERARALRQPWLGALLSSSPPSPALQRGRELLWQWSAAAARLTPHDLLDRIVHEGDLLERLSVTVPPARRGAALNAVAALLSAAVDLQAGRWATVYGFVRALRTGPLKTAPAAQADAVQLLTVHGAKGLEARAVFVVDSDPGQRQDGRATLLVDWPVEQGAPRRVAFVARESSVPPSLAGLMQQERAARQREEINALYVAMTRARQWLVASRTEPYQQSHQRTWWQRMQGVASAFEPDAAAVVDAGAGEMVEVDVMPAFVPGPAPIAAAAAHDAAAARFGLALHRMLEWAGRPDAPVPASRWSNLAQAAAQAFELPRGAAAELLQAARSVLLSPSCARFFGGPQLRWAANEAPLAYQGQMLRVDRLVMLDDGVARHWWVLDYKLNALPAQIRAHREQLQTYVLALREVVPLEPIHAALIAADGALHEL